MAAVHYKFKSAKDFDRVPIEGQAISVGSLKDKIILKLRLGGPCDFDLVVENAHTGQEYLDEEFMVQENTWVLVRRVPRIREAGIVAGNAAMKQDKVNANGCCKECSPEAKACTCHPKDDQAYKAEDAVQLADDVDVEEQLDYEGLDAEDYNIDDMEETPNPETILKESPVGEGRTVDQGVEGVKEHASDECAGKDATTDGQLKKPYGFPWKPTARHPYAVQYTGYWQASQMLAANNCRLPYGYNAFFPGVPFAHAPFSGYGGRRNNVDVRRERRRLEHKRGRNVRRSPSPPPRSRRSPICRLSPRVHRARSPPKRYRSRSPVSQEHRAASPAPPLRRKGRRSWSPRQRSLSPMPGSMSPRGREVNARPSLGLNRMLTGRDRDRDRDRSTLRCSRSPSRSENPWPPERCRSPQLAFRVRNAADVSPRAMQDSSQTKFYATEPGTIRTCEHSMRPSGRAIYNGPARRPLQNGLKRTMMVERLEPRRDSSKASVHDDLEGPAPLVRRASSLADAEYQPAVLRRLEGECQPLVRRPWCSQASFKDEMSLLAEEDDFGPRLYRREADYLESTKQPRMPTREREKVVKVVRRCVRDDAFDDDLYGEVVDDDYEYETQAETLRVGVNFSRGNTRRVVLVGQGSGSGGRMEAAAHQPRVLPVSGKKRTAVFVNSDSEPAPVAGGRVGKKRKATLSVSATVKSKKQCSNSLIQARSVFDRIGPPSGVGKKGMQQHQCGVEARTRMVVGYADLD